MIVRNREYYKNRLPSYLVDDPKYLDFVMKIDDLGINIQQTAKDIIEKYNIDDAEGDLLDKLGQVLALPRSSIKLDDNTVVRDLEYRNCLKGKILKNSFKGSYEDFVNSVQTIFGDNLEFELRDNFDMSVEMTITNAGDLNDYDVELLNKGYYFVKPMGVNISFGLTEVLYEFFMFEESIEINSRNNAFPQRNNPIVDGVVLINGEFYSG